MKKVEEENNFKMNCQKCGNEFLEKEIDVSHDVPIYMCRDKSEADKLGRHNICRKCHDIYEKTLFAYCFRGIDFINQAKMKILASKYSKIYFKKGDENDPI